MKNIITKRLSVSVGLTIFLFSVLLPYLASPIPAGAALDASSIKSGAKFAGCVSAGKTAQWLSDKINDGLKGLAKRFPKLGGFLNKLSGTGGTLVGANSVPTNDVVFNPTYKDKEKVQDVIARCAAREILSQMNVDIVNIARTSGRNGGPAFIQNWRSFQTDAQYRGEGIFRSILSNTKLCNYFSQNLKNTFDANGKALLPTNTQTRTGGFDSFQVSTGCTMPSGFNLTNYQSNFKDNGGWNAWNRLLEPQNNFYGALFKSLDEASKQRSLEESTDINQSLANRGLIGRSGENANDSCLQRDTNGKCLVYKDIKTPGTVISDALAATFQQELAWVANVDELNELIATAVEVLFNRLENLSNPNEGDYIIPNEKYDYDVDLPDPGTGGGGRCAGTNTGPIYEGELDGAIGAVVTANPGGIADELNTANNGFVFLSYLGPELERRGFNATATVLNGNDNPNQGDLIALQRPNEPNWERYDVIINSGAGNAPLRDVVGTDYVGTIPLSCITGAGGGGGGENPPPEQAF
ncbi:MAG: hypothetical protein WD989_02485 [Candidatus Paceibacterota bacterium]